MNVTLLQQEIQQLPDHLQDRLAAFLTALRMHRSGQDQEIFSRLDDTRTDKWMPWQQVKEEMSGDDPSAE
jgi:hypothetical protein